MVEQRYKVIQMHDRPTAADIEEELNDAAAADWWFVQGWGTGIVTLVFKRGRGAEYRTVNNFAAARDIGDDLLRREMEEAVDERVPVADPLLAGLAR